MATGFRKLSRFHRAVKSTIKVKLQGRYVRQGWLDANKKLTNNSDGRVVSGCYDVELAMHRKCTAFDETNPIRCIFRNSQTTQVFEI